MRLLSSLLLLLLLGLAGMGGGPVLVLIYLTLGAFSQLLQYQTLFN